MDPDEVEIGSMIIVQPGEKVPIDGVIVEGNSSLNTSALTGESLPRDVKAGEEVISGCINMTGVLKIRTEKNLENPRFPEFWNLWRKPVPENHGRRILFPSLQKCIPRLFVEQRLHWRSFRR